MGTTEITEMIDPVTGELIDEQQLVRQASQRCADLVARTGC